MFVMACYKIVLLMLALCLFGACALAMTESGRESGEVTPQEISRSSMLMERLLCERFPSTCHRKLPSVPIVKQDRSKSPMNMLFCTFFPEFCIQVVTSQATKTQSESAPNLCSLIPGLCDDSSTKTHSASAPDICRLIPGICDDLSTKPQESHETTSQEITKSFMLTKQLLCERMPSTCLSFPRKLSSFQIANQQTTIKFCKFFPSFCNQIVMSQKNYLSKLCKTNNGLCRSPFGARTQINFSYFCKMFPSLCDQSTKTQSVYSPDLCLLIPGLCDDSSTRTQSVSSPDLCRLIPGLCDDSSAKMQTITKTTRERVSASDLCRLIPGLCDDQSTKAQTKTQNKATELSSIGQCSLPGLCDSSQKKEEFTKPLCETYLRFCKQPSNGDGVLSQNFCHVFSAVCELQTNQQLKKSKQDSSNSDQTQTVSSIESDEKLMNQLEEALNKLE